MGHTGAPPPSRPLVIDIGKCLRPLSGLRGGVPAKAKKRTPNKKTSPAVVPPPTPQLQKTGTTERKGVPQGKKNPYQGSIALRPLGTRRRPKGGETNNKRTTPPPPQSWVLPRERTRREEVPTENKQEKSHFSGKMKFKMGEPRQPQPPPRKTPNPLTKRSENVKNP